MTLGIADFRKDPITPASYLRTSQALIVSGKHPTNRANGNRAQEQCLPADAQDTGHGAQEKTNGCGQGFVGLPGPAPGSSLRTGPGSQTSACTQLRNICDKR